MLCHKKCIKGRLFVTISYLTTKFKFWDLYKNLSVISVQIYKVAVNLVFLALEISHHANGLLASKKQR